MKQEIDELETLIDGMCRYIDDLLKQNKECSGRLAIVEENANRRVEECVRGLHNIEMTMRGVKKQLDSLSVIATDLSSVVEREMGNLENFRKRFQPQVQTSASETRDPAVVASPKADPALSQDGSSVGGIIGLASNQGGVFATTSQASIKGRSDSSSDKN